MPTVPHDLEAPAVTDDEIWLECAARLKIAVEAESDNRTQGIKALEFRDGQQWPDDLYNQRRLDKRPSLTINHTNTFCRRVVNNMRQQRPRIKVHPVGDGAQLPESQVIEGLIRHIENISQASVAYDTAGESAVNIGWGYFRIVGDYIDEKSFDQELNIRAVRNTFTGYIDPASIDPAGCDMEWFIFSEKMKRSDYQRQYPKAENAEYQHLGEGDEKADWESAQEIRLAEYYRVTKKKALLYQMSNGMALYKEDMAQLTKELTAAQVQVVGERTSFRRSIEWFRINGRAVVDKRELPGRYIPVVRVEGNVLDLNGRVRRKGMITDLMDPARMFNYWRSKETEVLALTPIAPWVGVAGAFDGHPEWSSANQKSYSRLEYEPVCIEQPDGSKTPLPPPERTPPVQVPAGFAEAAQSAQQDLMAVAGMPHEPGQDTAGSVVSGVALRQRQALSDIGHFQYYDNQTRAIAHGGRILLDLIPFYYSTQRMQRIIGEDGVPSMVGINQPQAPQPETPMSKAVSAVKNDLSIGRYDVVMDTGPGYESKRQEGAEAMLDLLKTPLAEPIAKVGSDLIVRNMDFAGADDLADRLMPVNPQGMDKVIAELPKQAQSIVKALQQQMSQMQQELQKAQLEIKYKSQIEQGWMQTEITKAHLAATTKAHDTETQSDTKRFDTHVKSVTARDVAEINAGAQLLNTHVESAHETVARRETLAAAEKAQKTSIQ